MRLGFAKALCEPDRSVPMAPAAQRLEVHVISMDGFSIDGVRRLEDQGGTGVIVGFHNSHALDAIESFANDVIERL